MSTLTQDQRQELKKALLEQRENLQRHFESSMEDGAPAQSLKDSTGELSSYDNHPADAVRKHLNAAVIWRSTIH